MKTLQASPKLISNDLLRLLIIFVLMPIYAASASDISAEAYGKDLPEAQERARASLASQIFVSIESNSEAYESDQGGNYFNASVLSRTDIPLYGVNLDCYTAIDQQFCVASMNTQKAIPLYEHRLQQARQDINAVLDRLNKLPISKHYDHLSELLTSYDQYEKYQTVLTFLTNGNATLSRPKISKQELKQRLLDLEKRAASLSLAAKLLTRGIDHKSVYVKPPTLENSKEITPFASALYKHVVNQVNSASAPKRASYFFTGRYSVHKKGLQVQYSLKNSQGDTVESRLVELSPESYANYRVTPLAIDFDHLLHKGYAVSSEFKVQLNTNKGKQQLLFKSGETIQILTKLNRAGYFYIVGHTKNQNGEQSYLLDLNDAKGKRKFINYVNADDANKWISLGEFEVIPPYGLESIQLFARESDPIDLLPGYKFDPDTQYYVISKNMKEAVRKTRGLSRKKGSDKDKNRVVEDVLTFTTQQ